MDHVSASNPSGMPSLILALYWHFGNGTTPGLHQHCTGTTRALYQDYTGTIGIAIPALYLQPRVNWGEARVVKPEAEGLASLIKKLPRGWPLDYMHIKTHFGSVPSHLVRTTCNSQNSSGHQLHSITAC